MVQCIFSEAPIYRRWRDLWIGAIPYEYVLESNRGCQTIMSLKKAADSAAFFNEEERRGVKRTRFFALDYHIGRCD